MTTRASLPATGTPVLPDTEVRLGEILAPVRSDIERVKNVFCQMLSHGPEQGDRSGDLPLPDGIRQAVQAFSVPVAERMAHHLARMQGKWLRAALTLLAARLGRAAAPPGDDAVRAAAAMELIHIATLIHDDIVDGAQTRRGAVALHREYGSTLSVLMGDYVFAKAFHLLTQTGNTTMLDTVARRAIEVCLGEIQQSAGSGDLSLSETEYVSLITYKTASLMAGCAKAGGLLGGLEEPALDRLNCFGLAFGVAFQIRDDVLDYGAEAGELGKTMLNDLRQGKATLPLIHLGRRLRASGREDLWRRLPELDAADVVELLYGEGCLESANRTAGEYARRAERELEALAGLVPNPLPVATLAALCRFVVDRGK